MFIVGLIAGRRRPSAVFFFAVLGAEAGNRRPKYGLYEAGRLRLRLWVQNDRKKIRLHRQPSFGRGSAFSYPIWPFEWLAREGAIFCLRVDTQPKPSRFRGREGCQNDRMVPNYPRGPAHVSTNGPHITIYIIIPSCLTIGGFFFMSHAVLHASVQHCGWHWDPARRC